MQVFICHSCEDENKELLCFNQTLVCLALIFITKQNTRDTLFYPVLVLVFWFQVYYKKI